MKKVIKVIKFILILITILLMVLIFIISKDSSVQASDNGNIKINVKKENFAPGGTVTVEILLQNQSEGISSFSAYFHYDKNIFEPITKSNIESNISEDQLDEIDYGTETGKISVYYNDDISNIGTICSINLKVKEDVNIDSIDSFETSLGKTEMYSYEKDELLDFGTIKKITYLKYNQNNLYLSSETYKIGDNDTENYEEGDKYISRISQKTTLIDYINNMETNGTIVVTKEDGTELTSDEYVGTGMTLTVTKDEEKIELKIAVTGDLDGNGKITATDLSTMNQTILKLVTLENEYKIAADLDENGKVTATDFSALNQMLL